MRPMKQVLDADLRDMPKSTEDAATLPATVHFTVKTQSWSSARNAETGKMKSEGKCMQMILVDFSEPQYDCALKSSSTTIAF